MNPNDYTKTPFLVFNFEVSSFEINHSRRVYGIFDILGELGGVNLILN
jgi:hypothetical protein